CQTQIHPLDCQMAQPVALRIASSDFNLSCSKQTDSTAPILQLEVSDDQLRTISAQGDTARFLFYMTTKGISLTTFESAKYPGWFISTSLEQRQPVAMCGAVCSFSLQR
uniref:Interleukin-1 n=1 Tax=Oncorhynchus kisutch TaxID=8019 RepID=A0A8C7L910_ONCKI